MIGNSRRIESAQQAIHPRLHEIVLRHIQTPYRRPINPACAAVFTVLAKRVAEDSRPLIFDTGCGTGASTLALAQRHPDRLVIGIDKSAVRLHLGQKIIQTSIATNALLLRCDLVDFWQLAQAAGWRCAQQYLLYPNPWPKAEHLKRRWHAHPVFPALLALGGKIELRTNWRIYAEEFAQALTMMGLTTAIEPFNVVEPLSPFERKYHLSGQRLWRVVSQKV